jgi:UDP-glucuronate 4-epimerase
MSTLITGGAGFIGSRLAMALRARGERVVLLDNFDPYYDPALKRRNLEPFRSDPDVQLIEGDVRDAALMRTLVVDHAVRRIAHMAALAGVRASMDEAPRYVDVNINGSVNLLDAAHRAGVEIFVQASTSSVYGESGRTPFIESDAADRPLAPYPATKRAAELLGHSYHHLFGLNVTCLRFFNVYGPHGRPDMMPLRVMQAIRSGQPITLYNGGALRRDWTYIDDIVAGIVSALERPLGYQILNLGCGAPIAMSEFVDIVEALSGKKAIRVDIPAPASEPSITYCDNTRARRLLDFAPKVQVRNGLARTWEWLQQTQPLGVLRS